MNPSYQIDKRSTINEEKYALVPRSKGKRQRNRFPENCVLVFKDAESTLQAAQPEKNQFPARVYGPCRSSEGFNLYYLVEWLSQ